MALMMTTGFSSFWHTGLYAEYAETCLERKFTGMPPCFTLQDDIPGRDYMQYACRRLVGHAQFLWHTPSLGRNSLHTYWQTIVLHTHTLTDVFYAALFLADQNVLFYTKLRL